MSTRSRIAVELPTGKVKSVYCHFDGDPSGVRKDLLHKDFETTDEVEAFIDEGDRSTVDEAYKERGEDFPADIIDSADAFFAGDIEEYGYLFTLELKWVYKKAYGINNIIKTLK